MKFRLALSLILSFLLQQSCITVNESSSSQNEYRIEVSISKQRVHVFQDDSLIKSMSCSTGLQETPSPLGEFKIYEKEDYVYIETHKVGVYFWSKFSGHISFHSLLYDRDGNIIQSEADKLGQRASAGCIRLKTDDAKWIFDRIPLGTLVLVS